MLMALRVDWETTGDPVLDRLGRQFVEQVACHARGGSYARRQVKYNTYLNFLNFLAERFGPEDIRNVQPRHVASFIRYLRDQERSEKRMLDYLSIIRWWHQRIPWRKYEIPENKALFELEARLDDKKYCEEIKNRYRRKGNEGAYKNLAAQLDKAWREAVKTKTGGMSRGSHFRYRDSMPKFLHFCAEKFRLEKLANVQAKHLHAYVDYRRQAGISEKTLKNDLAAIRFFHQLARSRVVLPDNRLMGSL
jgi:site-specific recombinase XerD